MTRRDAEEEASSVLWIDWGHNVRSHTLSRELGIELVEIRFKGPRIWRYIRSAFRTCAMIRERQPRVVVAANPSLVLSYLLLILKVHHRFRLVCDAHYFGIKAPGGHRILQYLLNFYNSRVDLVIVTNDNHARIVEGIGARSYVCQDPLPHLPLPSESMAQETVKVAFLICSFDSDEPYEAAFMAFAPLQEQGYSLIVSGDYRRKGINVSAFPWVRFLGYLPDQEYYGCLRSCTVVLDLTTMEDCLVCGAYEALAAGKPLVLSRTTALAEYFGEAAVLTENTPAEIRESVLRAFEQRDVLAEKVAKWVARNRSYMNDRIEELKAELLSLGVGAKTN